jgi:ferredoxin-like protein FixX
LDGFKIWPYVCTKKIAKMLASEVPKDWSKLSKTGQTPAKGTSSSSTQILPSLGNKSDGLLMTDGRNSFMGSNSSLVVLSGHPADISVVNRIKYSLETEGYTVWCSCDDRMSVASTPAGEGLPGSGESEDQIDRMIPSSTSCLPTINEGQSLESTGAFTDAYKELARSLVASKQRPTSLPPPPTTVCASPTIPSSIPFTIPPPVPVSQVSYSTVDGKHFQSMMEPTKRKTMLKRMLSDVCPLSSLTPDKRHRLEIFAKKVAECGVVIVVSSANYFNSATSKEQVYYCETRKKMIVVKADEFKSPPWFNNLMGIQLEVVSSQLHFLVMSFIHVFLIELTEC